MIEFANNIEDMKTITRKIELRNILGRYFGGSLLGVVCLGLGYFFGELGIEILKDLLLNVSAGAFGASLLYVFVETGNQSNQRQIFELQELTQQSERLLAIEKAIALKNLAVDRQVKQVLRLDKIVKNRSSHRREIVLLIFRLISQILTLLSDVEFSLNEKIRILEELKRNFQKVGRTEVDRIEKAMQITRQDIVAVQSRTKKFEGVLSENFELIESLSISNQ